jgi:hypothetical protein
MYGDEIRFCKFKLYDKTIIYLELLGRYILLSNGDDYVNELCTKVYNGEDVKIIEDNGD